MSLRRFRRTPVGLSAAGAYRSALFAAYIAYVILGNLPRPCVYLVGGGGVPVTEVLLALLAAFGVYYLRPRIPGEFLLVAAAVLVSSGIGYLTHGLISILPGIYAVRLVTVRGGSRVIAGVMQERWGNDPAEVFRFLTLLFLVKAGLGWILWAVFPETQALLDAMREIGLCFHGEPHQNRILGPLLDPNFFGNMLVLAIGVSVGLTIASGISWALGAYALFVATLLQTLSRSSALGLGVWCATFTLLQVAHRKSYRAPWKTYAALVLVGMGTVALFHKPGSIIVQRTAGMFSDPSAGHRFWSLVDAARLLVQPDVFFLGLGYNFLPVVLQAKYGLDDFDASMANLFVAFGLPLAALVIGAMGRWLLRVGKAGGLVHPIFRDVLVAYLAASISMSMFTNLLLFAPFLWVVMPFLCYLGLAVRAGATPRLSAADVRASHVRPPFGLGSQG